MKSRCLHVDVERELLGDQRLAGGAPAAAGGAIRSSLPLTIAVHLAHRDLQEDPVHTWTLVVDESGRFEADVVPGMRRERVGLVVGGILAPHRARHLDDAWYQPLRDTCVGHGIGYPETAALTDLQVVVSRNDGAAAAALDRGRVLGECCNRARAWANEPANVLTPRELGDRAAQVAAEVGLGVDVLDEARIAGLGMGLLLGVAQGSAQPPRLVVLRHDPTGAPSSPVLGLVGKGITFDTGGISIKPADGMERMKDDMAGGAAVVAAMEAIARLRAPIRVVAVVPVPAGEEPDGGGGRAGNPRGAAGRVRGDAAGDGADRGQVGQ